MQQFCTKDIHGKVELCHIIVHNYNYGTQKTLSTATTQKQYKHKLRVTTPTATQLLHALRNYQGWELPWLSHFQQNR